MMLYQDLCLFWPLDNDIVSRLMSVLTIGQWYCIKTYVCIDHWTMIILYPSMVPKYPSDFFKSRYAWTRIIFLDDLLLSDETVIHFLFDCPTLNALRKEFLPQIPNITNTLYENPEQLRNTHRYFVMANSRRTQAQWLLDRLNKLVIKRLILTLFTIKRELIIMKCKKKSLLFHQGGKKNYRNIKAVADR